MEVVPELRLCLSEASLRTMNDARTSGYGSAAARHVWILHIPREVRCERSLAIWVVDGAGVIHPESRVARCITLRLNILGGERTQSHFELGHRGLIDDKLGAGDLSDHRVNHSHTPGVTFCSLNDDKSCRGSVGAGYTICLAYLDLRRRRDASWRGIARRDSIYLRFAKDAWLNWQTDCCAVCTHVCFVLDILYIIRTVSASTCRGNEIPQYFTSVL